MTTGFEKISRDTYLQDHWIKRLVAFIIDSIIVFVGTLILATIFTIPLLVTAVVTGLPWYMFHPLVSPFFVGILSVLYFSFLESYYGWTYGKRIMNLTTGKLRGEKPPLEAAFIRNISKIYWVFALLDVIIGLATPGDPHQKISDRVAGTTVVSTLKPQPTHS